MNPSAFIRTELLRMAERFPQVQLRFQYDAFCQTHAIEVSPAYLHDVDNVFQNMESELIDRFTTDYPEEGVFFTLPRDIAGIEGEADGTIHGFWGNMATEEPEFIWPSETFVVMDPGTEYGRESFVPLAAKLHPLLQNPLSDVLGQTLPTAPAKMQDRCSFTMRTTSGADLLDEEYHDGTDYALAA